MRIALIVNPVSGWALHGVRRGALLRHVRDMRGKGGDEVQLFKTRRAGHVPKLVEAALAYGFDSVVVAGGDGTVNEAVSSLAGCDCPLGIVPLGSGNGLGLTLGIPLRPVAALGRLMRGSNRRIDTALIDGRPYAVTAGIGFDAGVAWRFARLQGRGLHNYARAAVTEALRGETLNLRISCDGGPFEEVEALMLVFANAPQWGNNVRIAPLARLDDGYLDLVIVKPFPAMIVGDLGLRLLAGQIHTSPYVSTRRFKRLIVESDMPLQGHIDGEPIELPWRFAVEVVPNSLTVRIPDRPERYSIIPR